MNKLPARPQITIETLHGKCSCDVVRYMATATIGKVSARGRSIDQSVAITIALNQLSKQLHAARKAMFPILRYHRDEWRYAFKDKEWGNVFGYGSTPELAYANYLKNYMFLEALLDEVTPPRKTDRIPAMDENCVPVDEPRGLFRWLQSLIK